MMRRYVRLVLVPVTAALLGLSMHARQGPPLADLALRKGGLSLIQALGEPLRYEAAIVNRGPGTATDVLFVDQLPSGAAYVAFPPECAAATASSISCQLGALAPGETKRIAYDVLASTPGALPNLGFVSSAAIDPNPEDNSDLSYVGIQAVDAAAPGADLVVTSRAAPDPPRGLPKDLVFQTTVENKGPEAARYVLLIDALQAIPGASMALQSWSLSVPGSCWIRGTRPPFPLLTAPVSNVDKLNIICTIPELPAGSSAMLTLDVMSDGFFRGAVLNSAGAYSLTSDPVLANNEDTAGVPRFRIVGDVNGDGRVDARDRRIVAGCQSPRASGQPRCQDADVNGDGAVDKADIAAVNANTRPAAPLILDYDKRRNLPDNAAILGVQFVSGVLSDKSAIYATYDPFAAPFYRPPGGYTSVTAGFHGFFNQADIPQGHVVGTAGALGCIGVIFIRPDGSIIVLHLNSRDFAFGTLSSLGPLPAGTRAAVFGGENSAPSNGTLLGVTSYFQLNPHISVVHVDSDNLFVDADLNFVRLLPERPQQPASLSLAGSEADLASGESRTFTVTILDAASNTVRRGGASTMQVTIVQTAGDGSVLGAMTQDAVGGIVTFELTGANAGAVTIEARTDDPAFPAALTSNALSFTVTSGMAATNTALVSEPNPSIFGQPVTVTATVTSGGGTPAGNVTFRDGTTVLGTATLDGSGQARLTTSDLTIGSHAISAVYEGNSSFEGSTSPTLLQTVTPASIPTSTSLGSSANPSAFGAPVTFTAAVTSGAGLPTGGVLFLDGPTVIGSATLDGTGAASFTATTLTVGDHSITAVYQGDGLFEGSSSPPIVQVVARVETTTTLISSPNPSIVGEPVGFLVTVSSAGGTPAGIVVVSLGGSPFRTLSLVNGQGGFTIADLPAGTHELTAVYNGDANFNGSSSPVLLQTVVPSE